jgi:hypothetical protein
MMALAAMQHMDQVGITVPNLDAASRFFQEAFDAKPMYDNIKRSDPPFAVPKAEAMLGLAPGTRRLYCRDRERTGSPASAPPLF